MKTRKSLRKSVPICVTLMLLPALLQAGGGWVKGKGLGYYKFGFSTVSVSGYFDGGNLYNPRLDSRLRTISFYSEHGIGEGVSAEIYAPIFMDHRVMGSRSLDNGESMMVDDRIGGLGDINLGLRFKILQKDMMAWSGTVTLGIPSGRSNLGERENLFTGDGEFNQLIRTDFSMPFGNDTWSGYSNVYGALNNRSRNFKNELWYGAEIGISHKKSRTWLIGRYNAIASSSGSTTEFSNNFNQNFSFSTYMVEAAFQLTDKHGFSASYTGLVDGNILLVAPTYAFGVYLNISD